ncbi:hypothetical protein ABW21_db0200650 [Orbilia brochopaga]|nr:hypothetical protein ABW21_db0200650 [Drechslerella brochopaga]
MATFNSLPIPLPPRTPTPPSPLPEAPPFIDEGDYDRNSLAPTPNRLSWNSADFQGIDILSTPPQTISYSYSSSPTRFNGSTNYSNQRPRMNGYATNGSTTTLTTTINGPPSTPPTRSPFNFKQMPMAPPTNTPALPVQQPNQRRGHRYKRSSISHQIFAEPKPRAPLAVPLSLPIPTFKEWRQSMTKEQKIRLQRAEVLIGFAMSVLLLFMGFDLIQHAAADLIEGLQGEEEHGHIHTHNHQRVANGTIDTYALLVISATLVSAFGLKNHVRIGKALRFASISSLPSVLSNPSHFLTLSCSGLLLLLPLLSVTMLVKILGSMLLMRFSGEGVAEVVKEIEQDSAVTTIEEASFWQVHYSLCMANLKIHARLSDASTEAKIRERVTRRITDRLGVVYGKGRRRWDVTIEIVPSL